MTKHQLAAICRQHPGWSVWESDTGHVYAVHCLTRRERAALADAAGVPICGTGSGTTVHACTASGIGAAIEVAEADIARAFARAFARAELRRAVTA